MDLEDSLGDGTPTLEERIAAFVPAPPPPAGSPDEPPTPVIASPAPPPVPMTPLNSLREALQPIARDLLCDRAYWESLKRTASPRTFLEFVRFAYAADLEGRPGAGNNQQVIIQAPFPQGPLDVLPPHLRIS